VCVVVWKEQHQGGRSCSVLLRTGYLSVGSVRRRSTLWHQSTRYPRLGLAGRVWDPCRARGILTGYRVQRSPSFRGDQGATPCVLRTRRTAWLKTDPGRLVRVQCTRWRPCAVLVGATVKRFMGQLTMGTQAGSSQHFRCGMGCSSASSSVVQTARRTEVAAAPMVWDSPQYGDAVNGRTCRARRGSNRLSCVATAALVTR
jgi:hypothetical protein